MTVLEKRQAIIKKMQEIPDEWVEKVDILLREYADVKDVQKDNFESLLEETTLKYKKVWEALA